MQRQFDWSEPYVGAIATRCPNCGMVTVECWLYFVELDDPDWPETPPPLRPEEETVFWMFRHGDFVCWRMENRHWVNQPRIGGGFRYQFSD